MYACAGMHIHESVPVCMHVHVCLAVCASSQGKGLLSLVVRFQRSVRELRECTWVLDFTHEFTL
jgi:hypothetical protein